MANPFKLVRQSEASECGLACIAMIAHRLGHDVNLAGLRARFGVSTRGANLRTLLSIASELGLDSRPLRAELGALRHLQLPAMAHWDMDHFVVIVAVSRSSVTVADPARGVMTFPVAEISSRFTGVIVEFNLRPSASVVTANRPRIAFRKLASLMPSLAGHVWQILSLALIMQLFYVILPLFTQIVVDRTVPAADIDLLNAICIGFAGAYCLSLAASLLSSWISLKMAQRAGVDLSMKVVSKLLSLPMKWHYSRRAGDTLAKLGSQGRLIEAFTVTAPSIIIDAVVIAISCIMLALYDVRIWAIVMLGVAATSVVSMASYGPLRRREALALQASIEEQSVSVDAVRTVQAVRMFGREADIGRVWMNALVNASNARIETGIFRTQMRLIGGILQAAQIIVVIYVAARISIDGDGLSVGSIFALLFFRQTLNDRVQSISDRLTSFGLASLHLENVSDILVEDSEAQGANLVHSAEDYVGRLELRGVWLKYGEYDRAVLRGIDLTIEPGEFVALVGPTGGGKTSLVKVLTGLVAPTSGEVRVDGMELGRFGLARWRQTVAAVMQDDCLIPGTIIDNIAFFDGEADLDRVKSAARMAALDNDIEQFPMKYWTWIGDLGNALSGGQRQRLLIARALYSQPKILFLDEGTANLDPATEAEIVQTISALPITRIIVAHRPALIEAADRVVEVRGGVLADSLTDAVVG